jgi:hypothetical protein
VCVPLQGAARRCPCRSRRLGGQEDVQSFFAETKTVEDPILRTAVEMLGRLGGDIALWEPHHFGASLTKARVAVNRPFATIAAASVKQGDCFSRLLR